MWPVGPLRRASSSCAHSGVISLTGLSLFPSSTEVPSISFTPPGPKLLAGLSGARGGSKLREVSGNWCYSLWTHLNSDPRFGGISSFPPDIDGTAAGCLQSEKLVDCFPEQMLPTRLGARWIQHHRNQRSGTRESELGQRSRCRAFRDLRTAGRHGQTRAAHPLRSRIHVRISDHS